MTENFILRSTERWGDTLETELSDDQVLDIGAAIVKSEPAVICAPVRDQTFYANENGTFIHRESIAKECPTTVHQEDNLT